MSKDAFDRFYNALASLRAAISTAGVPPGVVDIAVQFPNDSDRHQFDYALRAGSRDMCQPMRGESCGIRYTLTLRTDVELRLLRAERDEWRTRAIAAERARSRSPLS